MTPAAALQPLAVARLVSGQERPWVSAFTRQLEGPEILAPRTIWDFGISSNPNLECFQVILRDFAFSEPFDEMLLDR